MSDKLYPSLYAGYFSKDTFSQSS